MLEERTKGLAVAHGIWRRGREREAARRKMLDAFGAAIASDGQRLRRRETFAFAHNWNKKRHAAGGRFAFESDQIAFPFARGGRETKNLLAAGISSLRFAELCGFANLTGAFDFDEFVNHAEIARVGGSDEGAAYSESVDFRASAQKRGDFSFVEIAGDEDLDVAPTGAIELAAHPAAVVGHVTTIEADAGGLAAASDDFSERGANIVSVQKKSGLLGKNIEETIEGLGLVFESHDPGMRLRAVCGNAEKVAGENVGRSLAAGDERSARGENSGFGAVGAARTEFDDWPAICGGDDAGGAAGDHGLKIDRGEEARLEELAFDDGRGDAQERFVGENDRAFRNGPDFSRETEAREIVEKFRANVAENGMLAKVIDFFGREAHVFQEIEGLRETGSDEEIAFGRETPDEKLESGAGVKAGLKIAGSHGEFIEIGEKGGRFANGGRRHGIISQRDRGEA